MKFISKKYSITVLLILLTSSVFSQVGINTETPNRTLDVNGNLKVRTLTDQSNNAAYDRVLVTNSTGEVDAIKISELKDEILGNAAENKSLYYTAEVPDDSKVLQCGKFNFSFGTPAVPEKNLDIQMSLFETPSSKVNVYYTLFRKWGNGASKYYKSYFLTFMPGDYNTPQRLSSGLDLNEFGEIYITYPGEKNYYRVSFIARENYTEAEIINNSYTVVCEKF